LWPATFIGQLCLGSMFKDGVVPLIFLTPFWLAWSSFWFFVARKIVVIIGSRHKRADNQ